MKRLSFLLGVALFSVMALSSCKKNVAPVVTAVTVTPASVNAGQTAVVSVTATDENGDPLTYTYTVTGGTIAGNGASATWTAPTTAGTYTVSVTVNDDNDGSATGTGTLTVVENSPDVTQVVGTASFPAGTSGDLSNAKVSIYTSWDNWNANQPIKFTSAQGSGASVSFTITDINPGNYYLDVWKDNDNDAFWSVGDFVGWYGTGGLGSPSLTEFQIGEGETFNVSVSMYIIAKNGPNPKK